MRVGNLVSIVDLLLLLFIFLVFDDFLLLPKLF